MKYGVLICLRWYQKFTNNIMYLLNDFWSCCSFAYALNGSSSTFVRPRLNSKTLRCTVGNEGSDYFNTLTIFVWISAADKHPITKHFIIAQYPR